MNPRDIEVGGTYANRGAGRNTRKVLSISTNIRPPWYGGMSSRNEPGVEFENKNGTKGKLYLSSFAAWAGKEI